MGVWIQLYRLFSKSNIQSIYTRTLYIIVHDLLLWYDQIWSNINMLLKCQASTFWIFMKRGKRTSRCRRGSRKASPNITCHMYMANLQRYRGTNTHPSRVQGTPKKHIRCQTDAFTTQSYSVWWRLLHIHLAPAYPRLSFISEVIDLLQLACSIRCFLQLRLGPPMVAKGIKRLKRIYCWGNTAFPCICMPSWAEELPRCASQPEPCYFAMLSSKHNYLELSKS